MYKDLIVNLAIIVSVLAVSGQIFKHEPISSSRKLQFICGFLSGILGIILMFFTIKITDTTILDLRNFAIIVAALYGGIGSSLIAGTIIAIGRVLIFGINVSSLTAIITFVVLVIVCIGLLKSNLTNAKKFFFMNISNIMIIYAALFSLLDDSDLLVKTVLYYGVICLIGGVIILYICEYIVRANEDFRQNKLYAKIIETTQQGVSITDANGNMIFVNDGFTRITGYSMDEVIGKNPSILKSGKHEDLFYRKMWEDIMNSEHWEGEIWNKNKDGTIYPELINISAVKEKNGHITNYVAVFSDITKMKEAEKQLTAANERLNKLAVLDGLTGIYNRRYFDHELQKEWLRATRYKKPLSLIMFDIDYFKRFNDTYGHLSGDECLKQVAAALTDTAKRSTDVVARYGGEEFAIILPDANRESAERIAEEIRRKIESLEIQHINSEVSNVVTISVGIACLLPELHAQQEQLISYADQALYEAKKNGRNRIECYEENKLFQM